MFSFLSFFLRWRTCFPSVKSRVFCCRNLIINSFIKLSISSLSGICGKDEKINSGCRNNVFGTLIIENGTGGLYSVSGIKRAIGGVGKNEGIVESAWNPITAVILPIIIILKASLPLTLIIFPPTELPSELPWYFIFFLLLPRRKSALTGSLSLDIISFTAVCNC